MENKFESMTFYIDDWNKRQFGEDEAKEEMWKDISTFLRILTKYDYLAVVRDDDTDIIVVEYQHDDKKGSDCWGVHQPVWISPEEEELIHPNDMNEISCGMDF